MEIDKILSVSTANITQEDAQFLEEETRFTVGNFGYGFFLFTYPSMTNDEFDKFIPEKYSRAFFNLLARARRLGCRFLCLYRDADPITDLPIFEW